MEIENQDFDKSNIYDADDKLIIEDYLKNLKEDFSNFMSPKDKLETKAYPYKNGVFISVIAKKKLNTDLEDSDDIDSVTGDKNFHTILYKYSDNNIDSILERAHLNIADILSSDMLKGYEDALKKDIPIFEGTCLFQDKKKIFIFKDYDSENWETQSSAEDILRLMNINAKDTLKLIKNVTDKVSYNNSLKAFLWTFATAAALTTGYFLGKAHQQTLAPSIEAPKPKL